MPATTNVEDRIIELLTSTDESKKPRDVVAKLAETEERDVRRAIRALIDQGRLVPSEDWTLRVLLLRGMPPVDVDQGCRVVNN